MLPTNRTTGHFFSWIALSGVKFVQMERPESDALRPTRAVNVNCYTFRGGCGFLAMSASGASLTGTSGPLSDVYTYRTRMAAFGSCQALEEMIWNPNTLKWSDARTRTSGSATARSTTYYELDRKYLRPYQ